MSYHREIIRASTGEQDEKRLALIEEIVRNVVLDLPLERYSRKEIESAARYALDILGLAR